MKKLIALIMIITSINSANATTYPQRPHHYGVRILPEYENGYRYNGHNHTNDNHDAKALATVAIGLGIIAILYNMQVRNNSYKIEASESNPGQTVITRF